MPIPRWPANCDSRSAVGTVEEENRGQAREGQHLHDRGGAGEIVAIEADEDAIRQGRARSCGTSRQGARQGLMIAGVVGEGDAGHRRLPGLA